VAFSIEKRIQIDFDGSNDEDEVEVDSYNLGMDPQHLEVVRLLESIIETQAQILSRLRRMESRNGRTN
jgi:hypothetical protein